MSVHGSLVFEELSDRLGAFSCGGGKGSARYAGHNRKQNRCCYSRQGSPAPFPSLAAAQALGLQAQKLPVLTSAKHAGKPASLSCVSGGGGEGSGQTWDKVKTDTQGMTGEGIWHHIPREPIRWG